MSEWYIVVQITGNEAASSKLVVLGILTTHEAAQRITVAKAAIANA